MASRYKTHMGAKLRALRSRLGVSVTECAHAAGVCTSTWYAWEHALPVSRIWVAFHVLRMTARRAIGGYQTGMGF